MIERIARAIHRVDAAKGHDYDKMDCVLKARFEHIAQAVLTELSAGDGVQECDEAAWREAFAVWQTKSSPFDYGNPDLEIDRKRLAHEAAAAVIARRATLAAAAERARIVAWLRENNATLQAFNGPSIAPTKFARTLERIADAIEAGEV